MIVRYAERKPLLLAHVRPVSLETAVRAHFRNLIRKPDQGVLGFILKLQTPATKFNLDGKMGSSYDWYQSYEN